MVIRHVVDFIHVEKIIAYAIIETLFSASNIISSHQYFQELNIHQIFGLKNMMMKNIENLVLFIFGQRNNMHNY